MKPHLVGRCTAHDPLVRKAVPLPKVQTTASLRKLLSQNQPQNLHPNLQQRVMERARRRGMSKSLMRHSLTKKGFPSEPVDPVMFNVFKLFVPVSGPQ